MAKIGSSAVSHIEALFERTVRKAGVPVGSMTGPALVLTPDQVAELLHGAWVALGDLAAAIDELRP